MSEKIKILDLFAGVGGLSLGFELLTDKKGNCVFELHRAVEIDKFACETLRKRYGNKKVIEGDLTQLKIFNQIIDECKNVCSIVVGGIPCQSFSLLGPRSGFGKKMEKFKEDMRDNLYEHFRDIVSEIGPNIIVIENVKGILSKKDSEGMLIINKIISDFESLDYNLENAYGEKYHVLNAANYGVPQKRERVIIIGIKKSWRNIKVPYINPTHFDPCSKDATESKNKGLLPYVSLYNAIGDLPAVNPKITGTSLSKKHFNKIKKKNEQINSGEEQILFNRKIFEEHLNRLNLEGIKYFEHIRPNGYDYIDHHICRPQQLSDIKLFSIMKEGETAGEFLDRCPKKGRIYIKYDMHSFLDKYRKQEWSKICTTVFAHLEKDGNRFIHPSQARTITPREAARIQSFPDDFTFSGPICKKFRQIGNAVPPLLSKAIANEIYSICN